MDLRGHVLKWILINIRMTLCVCILHFVIRCKLNDRKKKNKDTHNFKEISDHKSQVVICRSVENEVKSQNQGKVISI